MSQIDFDQPAVLFYGPDFTSDKLSIRRDAKHFETLRAAISEFKTLPNHIRWGTYIETSEAKYKATDIDGLTE